MSSDGAHTYYYDAEQRIIQVDGTLGTCSTATVCYTYDGDGLRVEKSSGTLYWRSITGDVLAETDSSGNTQNEYVYFAGRKIAQRTSSGSVYFYYSDTLGTIHTITNGTGTACYDATFTPYGDEMLNPNISQTCSSNYKFTGYEYDSETGLYYAKARYYNPRVGRFMTPDVLGGDTSDPQSLNRYAYVLNAPTIGTDPLGLKPCVKDKVSLINSNLATVQPVANSLNIPASYILGLAYLESHDPNGGFLPQATQDNNWFGVTASTLKPKSLPPYSDGVTSVTNSQHKTTDVYTFPGPGIQQSLNWFNSEYGSWVAGSISPSDFAQTLVLAGYNKVNKGYATLLAQVIAGIEDTLKNCPDVKKTNGGGGGGGGAAPQPGGGGLYWVPTITWTLCNWSSSDGVNWQNDGCYSWTYIL